MAENNAKNSVEKKIEKDFKLILEQAKEEDYEQCAALALQFLIDHPQAKSYIPYVRYFKLFSEAYRSWQISYVYTPIRSRFALAYHALERGLNENKKKSENKAISKEDKILLVGFEQLSKMLCAYTKCENSFINNDPFALKVHAKEALDCEDEVLTNLPELKVLSEERARKSIKCCQIEMAEWLIDYLETNKLLHEGLKICAERYSILLMEQRPMRADEEKILDTIEKNNLEPLREKSAELSSELNAHICHIREHNERLKPKEKENSTEHDNTFLRINKGFLVNQMSVAFDTDSARELFSKPEKQTDFKKNIDAGFKKLGVKASGYQIKQLHDVFQTSFGETSLKTMSFDLWKNNSQNSDGDDSEQATEIRVKILNECYDFDLSFSLSALGVCTLYFKLNIDNLQGESRRKHNTFRNKAGLRVEEARVLQSLLCPHAGQVKITDALSSGGNSDDPRLNDFRFIDRIELADIVEEVEILRSCLEENPQFATNSDSTSYNTLNDAVNSLDIALIEVENKWLSQAKSEENPQFASKSDKTSYLTLKDAIACFDKALKEVGWFDQAKTNEANGNSNNHVRLAEVIKERIKARYSEARFSKPKKKIEKVCNRLDDHHYAAHLAEQYFSVIGEALTATLSENPATLIPTTDTGWYTYLYCRSIDKVSMIDPEDVSELVGFDKIANHPDMLGFVVEQREARASFDDWRFIKQPNLQDKNLAHIRSHLTDGFFCNEYQAFIYFPDDPMFLTDQYEATVKLMVRLATVLRYISGEARELAEQIHKLLHEDGQTDSSQNLDTTIRKILRLRLHAKELQTLVARAGISRYKDHGDLMKRILSEMKLDQMAGLLDRQLKHLAELYADILRKDEEKWREDEKKRREDEKKQREDEEKRETRQREDEEKRETRQREDEEKREARREAKASRKFTFLTALVALSAMHDLADSIVDFKSPKGYLTIILVVLGSIGLTFFYRRWNQPKAGDADKVTDSSDS